MQRWCFFLVFFTLLSCNFYTPDEAQTAALVREKINAIDWDDVDNYPLFDGCDEMAAKKVQRQCFEQEVLKRFVQAFSDTVYEVDQEFKDTLFVDFEVDEHGFFNIKDITEDDEIARVVPGFRREIRARLKQITVVPARKRGMNVKIKFRLPIILDTQE